MKVVEFNITQRFKTQVVVNSDSEVDQELVKLASEKADNMDHNSWLYEDTEYDAVNILDIPEDFTSDHITLLERGYPLHKLRNDKNSKG